jgi:DNA-binding transcriptional LysR family regulator
MNCHDANDERFFEIIADFALAHLRTLEAVASLGSFSRAAERLHLSQPAVSLHVGHLERAAGLPLVERVGKRVALTPAGDLLLAHAARAFGELRAAREALGRLRGTVAGRLRLGTGATASIYLLPPLLRRFRRRYPQVELEVVTGNSVDIVAAVVQNRLDVGIVTLPVRGRGLTVTPWLRDRQVAIAPAQRPFRRARPLSPAALARHPLILYERNGAVRAVIDGWFRRGGVRPRVVMELGNAEAIKKLVAAGLGLSVGSEVTVRSEVAAGRLVAIALDPPLARELGVVRRRDKPEDPVLETFLAALVERGEGTGRTRTPGRALSR